MPPEEFTSKYPYVISELVKLESSARLRALLPREYYDRSFEIIRGLDELKNMPADKMKNFEAAINLSVGLDGKLEKLQEELTKAYQKTYVAD